MMLICCLANRLQKHIDVSIDSRLESTIENKVHFVILHINDKFSKKQTRFAEPSTMPTNIGTFWIYAYQIPSLKPISHVAQCPPGQCSIEYIHDQTTKMLHDQYDIEPNNQTHTYKKYIMRFMILTHITKVLECLGL
jgi:hypothetical protein